MTQLNTEASQDLPSVDKDAVNDAQSQMLARLRALKTEASDPVSDQPRSHFWWISAAVVGAALLLIFLGATAWRLAMPSATVLDGGRVRLTDRQWGFQIDFPDWYQKIQGDGQSVQYTCRNVHVQVYNWKRRNFKPVTAAAQLASIVSDEQKVRPIKVLVDRSNELASPMIDFNSTCGQPGSYQWTVRERILIQRDVMIRVRITRPEDLPPAEIDRLLESVRWLK